MRQGRGLFSPCELHEVIYLCGRGSSLMEAFDTTTLSFLPYQIELPEDSAWILFIEQSQLVVLGTNYVLRWEDGEGRRLQLSSEMQHIVHPM